MILVQPFALLGLCEVDECCQNKTDEDGRLSCLIGYPNGAHSQDKYRADHPRCGMNGTCEPSVCNCVANNRPGGGFYCAAPINAICNGVTDANGTKWGFEGCYRDYPDYPDLQLYTRTVYCELAKCVVDGGTYGSCYCQVYHSLCELFGDVRMYHVSQNKSPIQPFAIFELLPNDVHSLLLLQPIPNAAGFCTIDTCCQNESSEAGKSLCFQLKNSTTTTSHTTVGSEFNTSVSAKMTVFILFSLGIRYRH